MNLSDRPELSSDTLPDIVGNPWRVRVLGPEPVEGSAPVVVFDLLLDPDGPVIVFPFVAFLMALRPPGMGGAAKAAVVAGYAADAAADFDPGPDPFPPAGDADHGRRGD